MLLLRTIIVLTCLTLLPAVYLGRRVWHGSAHRIGRRVLFGLDSALWLWAMYLLFWGEPFTAKSSYGIGVSMTIIVCLALPQLVFAIIHLITTPFKGFLPLKWRFLLGYLAATYVVFTIVYGYFYGAKSLNVVRYTYTSPLLPDSFSNFRIVQISDLHLGSFAHHPTMPQQIVDSINAEQADIVVFTGDLINFTSDEITPYHQVLSRIKAKYGVIAILGNHDYSTYDNTLTPQQQEADALRTQQAIRRMGWKLLLNENTIIRAEHDTTAHLYIAGTENETDRLQKANLAETWAGIPDTAFVLMLTHSPKYWPTIVATHNPALTLSGHIHGYQYAPLGVDRVLDYMLSMTSSAAHTDIHGHTLYVSKGVGTSSIFPIRYGAYPEINVITLRYN